MVRSGILLGLAIAVACWRPAAAASCLQEVEQVAQATGLAKNLPNIPGLSGGGAASNFGLSTSRSGESQANDANTPSQSVGSLLSQLNGSKQSSEASDSQKQAASLLESASKDGAQGDEQGCYAQLARAKQLLFGKK